MRPLSSPRSILLLLLLEERAMTAPQLAEELGMPASTANAYLHYFRRRGIIAKDGALWHLTPYGREYVKKYKEHFNYVLSIHGIKKNKEVSRSINLHKDVIYDKIREWAGEVFDECRPLIDFLVWWSRERGTYVQLTGDPAAQLAELVREFSSSSITTGRVAECLRELVARNVLFIYSNRSNIKVRLNKYLVGRA